MVVSYKHGIRLGDNRNKSNDWKYWSFNFINENDVVEKNIE